MNTKRAIAVLISDIHYSLSTLDVADRAYRAALEKAVELNACLVDLGDITNDKAILRAEIVKALMLAEQESVILIYHIVGNHSLMNEKSNDHALHFLSRYAMIVDEPLEMWWHRFDNDQGVYMIPYCSNQSDFLAALANIPKGSTVLCHQGFKGAFMGDYVQDKSSIDPSLVKEYTIISGHYHRHQVIVSDPLAKAISHPRGIGTITYLGNPYTLTFGEANDGPKGYHILYEDGTLEMVPLDLPRHIIINRTYDNLIDLKQRPEDKVWLKISGPHSELKKLDTKEIVDQVGAATCKIEFLPTESESLVNEQVAMLSDSDLLDKLIDNLSEPCEYKTYLKGLWRSNAKA